MGEEYRLPDVFVQLPSADDDELDHWEHVRDGYRIRISRYYDAALSFWWLGPVSEEVPGFFSGEWTEAENLEKASNQAWHAFTIHRDLDKHFGPATK